LKQAGRRIVASTPRFNKQPKTDPATSIPSRLRSQWITSTKFPLRMVKAEIDPFIIFGFGETPIGRAVNMKASVSHHNYVD